MKIIIPLIYFLLAILLFIGWQEQVCFLINKYLLPVTDIQSSKVWDGFFILSGILMGYGCRGMLNLKRVGRLSNMRTLYFKDLSMLSMKALQIPRFDERYSLVG